MTLTHLQSISNLPPNSDPTNYRGDTLRFHPPLHNHHLPLIYSQQPEAPVHHTKVSPRYSGYSQVSYYCTRKCQEKRLSMYYPICHPRYARAQTRQHYVESRRDFKALATQTDASFRNCRRHLIVLMVFCGRVLEYSRIVCVRRTGL